MDGEEGDGSGHEQGGEVRLGEWRKGLGTAVGVEEGGLDVGAVHRLEGVVDDHVHTFAMQFRACPVKVAFGFEREGDRALVWSADGRCGGHDVVGAL